MRVAQRCVVRLLGLPLPSPEQHTIVAPVSQALHGRESGGVGLTTRAVYELVEVMSRHCFEERLYNLGTFPASLVNTACRASGLDDESCKNTIIEPDSHNM